MKKNNIIIAAIAAASALLLCASCQKQAQPELKSEGKVFTAVIDQELTKTTITSDFKVNWVEGDKINVNGAVYSATPDGSDATKAIFTKESGDDPSPYFYAIYPASLYVTDHFEFPATQTYESGKFNAPMYAESSTESLSFKNICGVICFALKGTAKVKSISVTANEPICGTYNINTGGTLSLKSGKKTITLDCGDGVQLNESTATNFYIYLPPKSSYTAGMKIVITDTDGKVFKKTTTKDVEIARNNLYTFEWTPAFVTAGMLSGEFSVSDSKKVHFSEGNLRYTIASSTWSFFDNQYDCGSSYSSAVISLFTWGYNATNSIIPDGNHSNNVSKTSGDLIQSEDWGSRIGDGNTWRTLTLNEWKYLFNDRIDAANKVGYATVGGVNGIILLPDSFTDPLKNNGSGAFVPKSSTGWMQNVYTPGNWALMESAGAVFLPAAGCRDGSSVDDVGDGGYYWSSAAYDEYYAYRVGFSSIGVRPDGGGYRDYGYSVRLITESE